MSNINSQKAKVLGSIGAIQTLLEKFSMLINIDSQIPGETSFTFMLNVLDILGVKQKDIVDWLAKLLSGKGTDGFLYAVEITTKGILLANIRNLLTCSMNPMLPDKLMYKYKNVEGMTVGGEGIELDLNNIDLYGVLGNCPTSEDGSIFYFDAKESIYSTDEHPVEGYSTNNLWKSCDFNAYLWYVIHKGTNVGSEARKLYWDNRVKYIEAFKGENGDTLRNDFFTSAAINGNIRSGSTTLKKKQILICEYIERSEDKTAPNVLRVWLNDERYYHTRKVKLNSLKIGGVSVTPKMKMELNKTVFEFNYDYIMSLKLFETKTLVANIVNAILGISCSISGTYSIIESVVAAKIGTIVKNIIRTDDTEVADCYFTFDNDEYDAMLQESIKKHNGVYAYSNENVEFDYSSILDAINNIDKSATLQEQINNISNVFTEIMATPAQNGSIESKDNWTWGFDIINKLLEETVTQIVMQVLSPKVAILFQINQIIMGDIDPESDVWDCGWENFIKNFQNVIVQTIKEIKELILQQLLAWVLEQLKPLLELFISKLLLETINNYRILLKQLVNFCGLGWSSGGGNKSVIAIDNVNYADIVPSKTEPNNDKCG